MAGSTLKQGTGKELRRLFAMLTSAIGETLGSLVGRELVIRPGEVEVLDSESLVGALQKTCAVARGALDKGFAGKTLYTVFEAPDAVAMAGMLMMTPDDVIQQRRAKGNIEGEDAEAFGELGNVLCSGMGNVLREALGNIDIRLQDHGVIKPGLDKDGMLPGGAIVALTFKLKVGDFRNRPGTSSPISKPRKRGTRGRWRPAKPRSLRLRRPPPSPPRLAPASTKKGCRTFLPRQSVARWRRS